MPQRNTHRALREGRFASPRYTRDDTKSFLFQELSIQMGRLAWRRKTPGGSAPRKWPSHGQSSCSVQRGRSRSFACRKAAGPVAPDRDSAKSKGGFSTSSWTARSAHRLHCYEGDPTSKCEGTALEHPPTVALPLSLSVCCRRAALRDLWRSYRACRGRCVGRAAIDCGGPVALQRLESGVNRSCGSGRTEAR